MDPIFVQRVDCCSKECKCKREKRIAKKYNGSHGNHRKRAIKFKTEYDASVNLEDLIKRVGLRCALCGGMCDKTDCKTTKSGARIYGDKYPSIDHIIPMSKGGGHTWDNVQVAHRGCNTRKGNKVVA